MRVGPSLPQPTPRIDPPVRSILRAIGTAGKRLLTDRLKHVASGTGPAAVEAREMLKLFDYMCDPKAHLFGIVGMIQENTDRFTDRCSLRPPPS